MSSRRGEESNRCTKTIVSPTYLTASAPLVGRVSLLHLAGMPWARIGEIVGHDDLMTTARTYTHVVADEREIDYGVMLS